ncbi:von Willebrand factor type A domain-containing protein [Abyssibacter sp.]|uniref:vWA domain-containing protein n=1 Tax=Abyssibacter sp. TaxID=2320200 RepID=UPI00351819FE
MKSRVAGSLMLGMAVAVGLAACAGGNDRRTLAEQAPTNEPDAATSEQADNPRAPQHPVEARAEMAQAAGQAARQKQAIRSALFAQDSGARMLLPPTPPPAAPFNREGYEAITENRFHDPQVTPLSTFGLDVDTASYTNLRRLLNAGQRPPIDAVRIEELVNYFDYSEWPVNGRHPIRLRSELAEAPWADGHLLAMVQVAALAPKQAQARPNRLVFLIDTSGSMQAPDKLPMLQRAFRQLTEQLGPEDSVAIVTYAGNAGVALPATRGDQKSKLYEAIGRMQAGGSTAGARGIELAYQIAQEQFDAAANNRVILATDGDFNVGASSQGELVRLIEQRRDQGIYLTVLGFGTGNYQDGRMHRLADHGDGNYYYIDTDLEARRVLVDKLQGTLVTVAKDVKLQVEFNPQRVAQYRLLGYETRALAAEDFKDDRKDAGDVGAGQRVTALYEIVPVGAQTGAPDALRYQTRKPTPASQRKDEWMLVKARYKQPDGGASTELRNVVEADVTALAQASADLQWAAAVAEFGLVMRKSEHAADASFADVLRRSERLAQRSDDPARDEFVGLVRQANLLAKAPEPLRMGRDYQPAHQTTARVQE